MYLNTCWTSRLKCITQNKTKIKSAQLSSNHIFWKSSTGTCKRSTFLYMCLLFRICKRFHHKCIYKELLLCLFLSFFATTLWFIVLRYTFFVRLFLKLYYHTFDYALNKPNSDLHLQMKNRLSFNLSKFCWFFL